MINYPYILSPPASLDSHRGFSHEELREGIDKR